MKLGKKEKPMWRWRPWFAWHPVKVDEIKTWVWWESLERCRYYCNADGDCAWFYRHAGSSWQITSVSGDTTDFPLYES